MIGIKPAYYVPESVGVADGAAVAVGAGVFDAPWVAVGVAPLTTICTKISSPKNAPAAVVMRQFPR